MNRTRLAWLSLLVVASAAALWLPQLPSGLWLDEFDTFVTAKDGIWKAIARTRSVHPQCSQAYNALMAAWYSVAGTSEIAMRIPSIAAMSVATMFVYRIGRLVLDREAGLLAAVCFVSGQDIVHAAGDARPYAFAVAASAAATEAWLRFLAPVSLFPESSPQQRGDMRFGAAWAAAAALTFYFHQLFAVMLLVHGFFAIWAFATGETKLPLGRLAAVGVIALGLVALELPNFLATMNRRALLSYSSPPSPETLIALWCSPVFIFSLLPVAVPLYAKAIHGTFALPRTTRAGQILVLAWAITPPLVMFLISRLTDTQVFQPRYFLACQPALALIGGLILRGFAPDRLRMAAAVCVAATAIVLNARTFHGLEDWAALTASVNEAIDDDTPVAAGPGFIESSDPEWLRLPEGDPGRTFLLAPLAYHPVRGPTHILPYVLNDSTRDYMEELLQSTLIPSDRFVVLGRGRGSRWWSGWLEGRLAGDGFSSKALFQSKFLEARLYERPDPPNALR